LGLKTTLVGAIGNDDMGRMMDEMLRNHRVDTSLLHRRSDMPTAATILAINSKGERPTFHAVGASVFLEIDDERRKRIVESRFVHWGGAGTMLNLDGGTGAEILKEAKSSGAVVTCDFISPMEGTLAALKNVMPHVDYFMPSLEEAMEVSSTTTPDDAARAFLDMGAKCCILKCGAKGSRLVDGERNIRIPAFQVDVYDTTGCGDSYCAGFIAALSRGWEVEKACQFGSAVAAIVATGLGSDAGITDFSQAENVMNTFPTLEM
jgi:sugar/nucleoside kinase (ribokinase family)